MSQRQASSHYVHGAMSIPTPSRVEVKETNREMLVGKVGWKHFMEFFRVTLVSLCILIGIGEPLMFSEYFLLFISAALKMIQVPLETVSSPLRLVFLLPLWLFFLSLHKVFSLFTP